VRTALAVVLGCSLALVGTVPAHGAWNFELGIGEQQADMFSDPRFAALGLGHVRVVTPYDVACDPSAHRHYLDIWLAAARRAGARPLVAFSVSWRSRLRWKPPTYRRFLRCFRAFRARYPQVRDFNAWNEANHSSQPTFRHPRKAAGFYNAVRRGCPRCAVAAGDLLDWGNLGRWLERYRPHLRGRPRLWSIHNYGDVNHARPWRRSGTVYLLRRTRGRLWITETGGVVHTRHRWLHDERRAATATKRMFVFARRSRRISRVYAYQWQAGCERDAWDSAWLRSDGSARPSYRVVVAEIARERGLDPTAAAALDPPLGPAMRDTCAL
jgi:polysaccharide biosynthesis protein PslG